MSRVWQLSLTLGAAGLCLALTMCGGESDSADTGTSGTTSGDTSAATTGTGGCTEAWVCTAWETGGAGDDATRTCTDQNACGTATSKPIEATALPALDLNYYKCNVEPIFDKKCAQLGCHGTEEGRPLRIYARGRLRAPGATFTNAAAGCQLSTSSEQCTGSVTCECREGHTEAEWQKNYDSARGFALGADGTPLPAGQEDTSELIAQPIVGGKAHAGIHLFKSGDSDHTTIQAWIGGATLASCDTQSN